MLMPSVNRFPCGHLDVASYCRACREALLDPPVERSAVPSTYVEAAAYRDQLLKDYQACEAQSARVGKGEKFRLSLQRERLLDEYKKAKQLAHDLQSTRGKPSLRFSFPALTLVAPDVDDETAVPMRNADYLLYVRRRISSGIEGAHPRPKVKS